MQRYKILHRTYYNFSGSVQLGLHTLRLRPRESHQIHIESSTLTTTPPSTLRWHRDAEDNSIAVAAFEDMANQLFIESEVILQQYNESPFDFIVAEHATNYPFLYDNAESVILSPYMSAANPLTDNALTNWISTIWQPGEVLQTYSLLQRINIHINSALTYSRREEPGVQSPAETLSFGSGSCRDFANLFMQAARQLGFASRFVSGYLNTPLSTTNYGATHAWAEVYLPGAGWTGFDPTLGELVGSNHIAVAVSRLSDAVPPIAGSFIGPPGASLDVGVWVTEL